MVENSIISLITNRKERELYWIIEHEELCWAPGEKKDETN
jgi:hypothetical protein